MKTYTFTKASSPSNIETYTKTEAELTKQEKEFLLGDLINSFEKAPVEVQNKFLYTVLKLPLQ